MVYAERRRREGASWMVIATELGALKGNDKELQEKLALVEQLTRQSQQVAAQLEALGGGKKKPKKPREKYGNTEQPKLPVVEEIFKLDEPTRCVRAAAASCRR